MDAIRSGLGFGVTSGILTTLGIIVGLTALGATQIIIIGGILTIAISDTISDSIGMNIAQRNSGCTSWRKAWSATLATFLSKSMVTISFILPQIIFSTVIALIVSCAWGALLLLLLSIGIAAQQKTWAGRIFVEYLIATALALAITYHVQHWIHASFA